MQVHEIDAGKEAVCRAVLDDLPDWFGLPAARDAYVAASRDLPMLVCTAGSGPAGFVSIRPQTADAAELHVLGVKRRFHRRGIGRALIDAALAFAAREGHGFVTVKTLAPTHPDPNYAATRRFYDAMGFRPLEIFPTLWGADHPCLLLIRPVQPRPPQDPA